MSVSISPDFESAPWIPVSSVKTAPLFPITDWNERPLIQAGGCNCGKRRKCNKTLRGNKLIHTGPGSACCLPSCFIIPRGNAILLPGWITDENDSNVGVSIKRKEQGWEVISRSLEYEYLSARGGGRKRAARITRQWPRDGSAIHRWINKLSFHSYRFVPLFEFRVAIIIPRVARFFSAGQCYYFSVLYGVSEVILWVKTRK